MNADWDRPGFCWGRLWPWLPCPPPGSPPLFTRPFPERHSPLLNQEGRGDFALLTTKLLLCTALSIYRASPTRYPMWSASLHHKVNLTEMIIKSTLQWKDLNLGEAK